MLSCYNSRIFLFLRIYWYPYFCSWNIRKSASQFSIEILTPSYTWLRCQPYASMSASLKSSNDCCTDYPPWAILYLLRFRLNKFAFTADFTKMYRQVLIDQVEWNFHIILSFSLECRYLWYDQCSILDHALSFLYEWSISWSNSKIRNYKVWLSRKILTILEAAGFLLTKLTKWFLNHSNYLDKNCEKFVTFKNTNF